MRTELRVGELLGVPLFLDLSWFFILSLSTVLYQQHYLHAYSIGSQVASWIGGGTSAMLLLGSVLLHELGHSLVARSQSIKIRSITLFLFGGIAAIEQDAKTPYQAFQVAIAGPAVSLTLASLLGLLAVLLPDALPAPLNTVKFLSRHLAILNLVLGIFNLMPGLPLDGGQVLKAVVWKMTGSRFQGGRWAVRIGRLVGGCSVVLGLAIFLYQQVLNSLWILLAGGLVWRNANLYDRLIQLQETLLTLKAANAMNREFRVVDVNLTLRQFADKYLLEASYPELYFAASKGRYQGMVSVSELGSINSSHWKNQTLQDILQPFTEIISVVEKTSLVQTINLLEHHRLHQIAVLSAAGAISGTIDRGDIVRAVTQKLNVFMSETEIQCIKEEGRYPPGLQLQAIARSLAEC